METIRVRRTNVVLNIQPHEKQDYMDRGFSVVDEKGQIIEEALPNDVKQLQKMVLELRIELAEMKQAQTEKKSTKKKTED